MHEPTKRPDREISGADRLEGALSVAAIRAGVDFHTERQWSTFCQVTRDELRERGISIVGRQRDE